MLVQFTPQEKELFLFLVNGNGDTKTRNMIEKKLYPHSRTVDLKIIDVLICKIRKKLKRVDADQHLKTVRGQGYRWGEPPAAAIVLT